MTVALAATEGVGVHLASDSLVSDDMTRDYCQGKWFPLDGGVFVAYAGADEPASILRGALDPVAYPGGSLLQWVERSFLPEVRDLLDDPDDIPEMLVVGGGQIVVCSGGAYESTRGYAAIGCGALGALCAYAVQKGGPVRDKVMAAVHAAAEHADGCGGDVRYRWVP